MTARRFHGDPERFAAVAAFITAAYGQSVYYIADVAGGQGMLARLLNKRGYEAEVIDPRGWTLNGVASRHEAYVPDMAGYYDLIVGLHPDQALRPVVESAVHCPILVVPCCNFWDREDVLGRDALIAKIEAYLQARRISFQRTALPFQGPNNICIATFR